MVKKAYILAGISIVFWSTVATVSKLLLGSLTSMQVLCVSAFFAALALLVVNVITGNIKKLRTYTLRDYGKTVLIGLPGTFFYYLFYYTGTSYMPASQAFIINYLWPIMSVVFACIILKEPMTVRKAVAIGLSFVGVIIVTGGNLGAINGRTLIGTLFCILGAIAYGLFTALNQKGGYDKRLSMMLFFFTTFILTSVINLVTGSIAELSAGQVLGLAWNGVFSIALATTSWAIALECGKTAQISNLAYITPFLSLVWTALLLKEPIQITSLAGLAVIVLGIFIQMKRNDGKE